MKFALFLVASTLAAQQYFPPDPVDREDDRSYVGWDNKFFRALEEPSLWELSKTDPKAEVYRFIWLRSFHQPITVRLTISGHVGRLVAKKTNGKGGYEPGHLVYRRESSIPDVEWVLNLIEEMHFWNLPTEEKPTINPDGSETIGVDGAQWIVEGVKAGKYHAINRWSPDTHDPAHAIGILFLIDLAHFRLLYQEVY